MGRFRNYLWWKETKHNIFGPPPKKLQQALSKRSKRLNEKLRPKFWKFKISLKFTYIVPFLSILPFLVKMWKNNPFPSPTSFLVPKQAFKRLEIAFWRNFEKSAKNSEKPWNRDVTCSRHCIFVTFGPI